MPLVKRPRLLRPPGVFAPRSDSWLLAGAVADAVRPGMRVLDLCTGSGLVAVAAAQAGASHVVAVDVSRRAALAARLNARLNGVRVEGRRGDLFDAVAGERFGLVASNPPYVPSPAAELPRRGPARAWDAGPDGRALLDRICSQAPQHLAPGGTLLLVHSSLCDEHATCAALERGGLRAEVLLREPGPLGPMMRARAGLAVGDRLPACEDLVVVAGRAP